jgi:hypothetical protein
MSRLSILPVYLFTPPCSFAMIIAIADYAMRSAPTPPIDFHFIDTSRAALLFYAPRFSSKECSAQRSA